MSDESARLPDRRSVRMKGFDYGHPCACFLTICTNNRKSLFGRMAGSSVALNKFGMIVGDSWLEIPRHFPHASLSAHIVMPNHLHGIVTIHCRARHAVPLRSSDGPCVSTPRVFGEPEAGAISTIVRSFKSAVSKRVHQITGELRIPVWQRGYYEHVIRNQDDFMKTVDYIRLNPIRWIHKRARVELDGL